LSTLIYNERVAAIGAITETASEFLDANETIYPKSIMPNAFVVDAEPSGESALGWIYSDGQFIAVQPEEKPVVVTAPAPTKEELMAQLAALTAKIQALE
jgi:hypothetical protein